MTDCSSVLISFGCLFFPPNCFFFAFLFFFLWFVLYRGVMCCTGENWATMLRDQEWKDLICYYRTGKVPYLYRNMAIFHVLCENLWFTTIVLSVLFSLRILYYDLFDSSCFFYIFLRYRILFLIKIVFVSFWYFPNFYSVATFTKGIHSIISLLNNNCLVF